MNLRFLRRYFLPSRTIARYMARLFLVRFFGLLAALVIILQMLDLLAQSDEIMAASGADFSSILTYLRLRIPQLISQFIPFSVLLAALLSFARLSQSSEIAVMKATGLSAHHILLPFSLASCLIALCHFAFNETITVRSSAALDWWRQNDYALDLPPPSFTRGEIWLKEDAHLIHAERASPVTGGLLLDQIAIYEQNAQSGLTLLTRADFALYQKERWILHHVRHFDTQSHVLRFADTETWDLSVRPSRFLITGVKPDHSSIFTLWPSIKAMAREGLPTNRLMTSFFHKFTLAFSSVLMPLLAAFAAFGLSRRGSIGLRFLAGLGLGFSFFVADSFMLAMGEFGIAPPFLAAFMPIILFLMLGYSVIFTSEEGRTRWAYRQINPAAPKS